MQTLFFDCPVFHYLLSVNASAIKKIFKVKLTFFFAWHLFRQELLEKLPLDWDDTRLEEKLEALVRGDIITQGPTHFDYRGVQDNIFDKVFRGVYEKEIRESDVRMIRKEYSEELQKLKKQYDSL